MLEAPHLKASSAVAKLTLYETKVGLSGSKLLELRRRPTLPTSHANAHRNRDPGRAGISISDSGSQPLLVTQREPACHPVSRGGMWTAASRRPPSRRAPSRDRAAL